MPQSLQQQNRTRETYSFKLDFRDRKHEKKNETKNLVINRISKKKTRTKRCLSPSHMPFSPFYFFLTLLDSHFFFSAILTIFFNCFFVGCLFILVVYILKLKYFQNEVLLFYYSFSCYCCLSLHAYI